MACTHDTHIHVPQGTHVSPHGTHAHTHDTHGARAHTDTHTYTAWGPSKEAEETSDHLLAKAKHRSEAVSLQLPVMLRKPSFKDSRVAVPHSSLPEALADTEEAQAMAPALLESILAQRNAGGHSANTESPVSWWFTARTTSSWQVHTLAATLPHSHPKCSLECVPIFLWSMTFFKTPSPLQTNTLVKHMT